ncbi:hypothetical protein BGZ63DRAFT_347995 [Mariannaea sp. PMI_226]|nr:hypothetical protein BGZ63DRAFT_347995 [Mariannaea sp. PMI_226]
MAHASSSSLITTPISFMTADHSAEEESTAASTPLSDNPAPYLRAQELSRDLKAHTQIYFEEQLYPCAINLLHSITASSNRRRPSKYSAKPINVPPATQLALLNTLLVHPQYTTRAEREENLDVPTQALNYLQTVLQRVGPINADFRTAFKFHPAPRIVRRWERPALDGDSDGDDAMDLDDDRIRGRIANEGSVWSRGQDLWFTVGWAFNCSSRYPRRWRYWKVWLQFMMDVLEADWKERERLDDEAHEAKNRQGEAPRISRETAMILMYMEQTDGRTRGMSGILKALFADGSDLYSSTFREVFDKELRGPRKEGSKKRKRDDNILDLENDKFGDYFEDESMSSGVSEPPTPQKPRDKRGPDSSGGSESGLAESISLRLRLFMLISTATFAMRKSSDLIDLYERYSSAVKLLPLDFFALIMRGAGKKQDPLIQEARVTLLRELFFLLIPSSYKDPNKVDPESEAEAALSTPLLEHCFIIHPANTVAMEDNAKLSLLVEAAIQLLIRHGTLEYSPSFAEAAEKGIKAREAKVRKRRTGKIKTDPGDELAYEVLINSGKRIKALLQ